MTLDPVTFSFFFFFFEPWCSYFEGSGGSVGYCLFILLLDISYCLFLLHIFSGVFNKSQLTKRESQPPAPNINFLIISSWFHKTREKGKVVQFSQKRKRKEKKVKDCRFLPPSFHGLIFKPSYWPCNGQRR
jgi:hypothetical protein